MSVEQKNTPLTIPGSEDWEPGLETVLRLYGPLVVLFVLLGIYGLLNLPKNKK